MQFLLRHKFVLLAIGVFSLYLFTRLYNLEHRITFGWDQEQFSNQIWDITANHKPTLLGPRTNNDRGFFLAPYFTYMLIPLYLITHLHPFALYYFIVLINIAFATLAFLAVFRIFSVRHALLFLVLWSLNPLTHMYDGIPWWPLYIPLGVMLTLLFLHYLYHHPKNILRWCILGIALGFFANMHFQFVFMIFFVACFIGYEIKMKRLASQTAIATALGFLLTLTPLILFDIRHQFLNIQLLFNFFFTKTDVYDRDIFVWILPFMHFLKPIIIIPSVALMQLFYLAVLGCMGYAFKHSTGFRKVFYRSSIALWLFTLIFFGVYGKRPSEYYFLFLMPFIFITFADIAVMRKKITIAILISMLLALIHIDWFRKNVQTDYAGLMYKDRVLTYIEQRVNDREFFLTYDGVSIDNGYHYLIRLRGLQISKNEMAPLIEITLPARKGSHVIGSYGVVIPQSLK